MKNWYIVQSHSNFENKVAKLIKEEAEKLDISEKIEACNNLFHERLRQDINYMSLKIQNSDKILIRRKKYV